MYGFHDNKLSLLLESSPDFCSFTLVEWSMRFSITMTSIALFVSITCLIICQVAFTWRVGSDGCHYALMLSIIKMNREAFMYFRTSNTCRVEKAGSKIYLVILKVFSNFGFTSFFRNIGLLIRDLRHVVTNAWFFVLFLVGMTNSCLVWPSV